MAYGDDKRQIPAWILLIVWASMIFLNIYQLSQLSAFQRVDPASAIFLAPFAAMWIFLASTTSRRWVVGAVVCSASFAGGLLITWIFTGQLPVGQAFALSGSAAVACIVGMAIAALFSWRDTPQWQAICVLISLSATVAWVILAFSLVGRGYALRPLSTPLQVATMTSLPFGFGEVDIADALNEMPSPPAIIAAVQPVIQLNLIDAPTPEALRGADLLLLAHPRAMSGEVLVAIDAWVRAGGRAIILADPISRWSIRHHVGDPRNGPFHTLLTPLLTHWGLTLAADSGTDGVGPVSIIDGQFWLNLSDTGQFTSSKRNCVLRADRHIAECRVGRGRALIVADADFLNDSNWGNRGWPRGGDTPFWLADRAMALARSEQFAADHAPWFRPVHTRR